MNETVEASLFSIVGNTSPEYANLGMSLIQLLLLSFYGFLKLKKRVTGNEARLRSMRNRLDLVTEL